jgi:hypothetical protein
MTIEAVAANSIQSPAQLASCLNMTALFLAFGNLQGG